MRREVRERDEDTQVDASLSVRTCGSEIDVTYAHRHMWTVIEPRSAVIKPKPADIHPDCQCGREI